MLGTLRDVLMAHMESMSVDEVRKHILSQWMDAGDLYPYYIKVTGRGTAAKGYNASAEDPSNNDQFRALVWPQTPSGCLKARNGKRLGSPPSALKL